MANIVKIFTGPLEKTKVLFDIVKSNGGILGSAYQFFRTDELKKGTLIGEDKYGNKYYENKSYFMCRNRWVVYNENVFLDYDGSQVPAEWFGWLHYKTDLPPTVQKRVDYEWLSGHKENMSGTKDAWMPYSTTKPKVQAWVPKTKQ